MAVPGVPIDKIAILDAIALKKGVISDVAELLKCERQTIYNWMYKDEDINNAIEEERRKEVKERIEHERRMVRKAYKTMEKLIEDGDVTGTIFTLKTKAGWTEKSHSEGNIKVTLQKPFEDKV